MIKEKKNRCDEINASVKRKENNFEIGQWVYIRNRNRRSKFQPLFLEEPWIIESLDKVGVTIRNPQLTKTKVRHIDDVKPYFSIKEQFKTTEKNIPDTYFTIPKQTNEPFPASCVSQQTTRSKRNKISTYDTKYRDFTK